MAPGSSRRRRPTRPGALADLSPRRILTQILTLQALYYLVSSALITFVTLVAGKPLSPSLIFGWDALRADLTTGWTLGLCWMFTALVSVVFILLLIARSKLVPDFALTIHVLHLLVVSVYSGGLPRNLFWWEVQGASAALMTGLGIWACQWRELKPMAFGGRGGAVRDAGEGNSRGSARDAVYEMIGMAQKDDAV